jgi:hypothetical protein
MARHGEPGNALSRGQHGQNGHESGSGRGVELALDHAEANRKILDALKHIGDVAEAQQKRARLFTSLFTTSIPNAGALFSQMLHLPEESAIATAVIENNSAVATLTVYEGAGGGGRIVGIVGPLHYKRIALGDHVSSISVVADKPDPAAALVFVTLSTRRWSPQQSTIT